MKALRLVAGAAIMLGPVAACGQPGSGAAPAGPPQASSTSVPAELTPAPPDSRPPRDSLPPPLATSISPVPGATPVPKSQVDASGLADTSAPPPDVSMTADGRTLILTVMARDACSGVAGTVTEETAEAVKILVTPMLGPQGGPADQVCAQVLTPRQVSVQLAAPLGRRMLFITEGY